MRQVLLSIFPSISWYLSSAAKFPFFLPSSGCKAPGDLREQMWYLGSCSEQSGCFENIHSKASYNTRCESSKAASCVYILISPARKAGVFMHWKLIIQAACSNNLLLLYGAVHFTVPCKLLCKGPTLYKTETPTGLSYSSWILILNSNNLSLGVKGKWELHPSCWEGLKLAGLGARVCVNFTAFEHL